VSDLYEKISFYKGLYKEIAVGFSEDEYLGKPIFIKHFTELENGELDKYRSKFSQEAIDFFIIYNLYITYHNRTFY